MPILAFLSPSIGTIHLVRIDWRACSLIHLITWRLGFLFRTVSAIEYTHTHIYAPIERNQQPNRHHRRCNSLAKCNAVVTRLDINRGTSQATANSQCSVLADGRTGAKSLSNIRKCVPDHTHTHITVTRRVLFTASKHRKLINTYPSHWLIYFVIKLDSLRQARFISFPQRVSLWRVVKLL